MRGFYLFYQEITAITDQKTSFSVVSVVSVVRGLYLSFRYLQIIDTSNENKIFSVITVVSVMSVLSFMRSLHLIDQK